MVGTALGQNPRSAAVQAANEAAVQPQGQDAAGEVRPLSRAGILESRLIDRADQIAIAEDRGAIGQQVENPVQLPAVEPLPVR